MDSNRFDGTLYLMKKSIILLLLISAIISCGKNESNLPAIPEPYILANLQSMPFYADTVIHDRYPAIFKASANATTLVRPQQIKTHLGDLSEMYLNYLFIGMISKKYQVEGNSIDIELIQFADETNAYGFYSVFRPHGIKTDRLGTESFQHGHTRYMVKGDYVVQISTENQTAKTDSTLFALCKEINNDLIGSTSTPPIFLLFPFSGKIVPSTRYYTTSYLNIPGLDQVYTTSYLVGDDTVTLFMALDTASHKFAFLKHFARDASDKTIEIKKFDFPPDQSIAFPTKDYGVIVAGLKSQKLLGTTTYKPKSSDKLYSGWVKGIQ